MDDRADPAHDASPGWDEAAASWDDDPAVRAYADAAFESLLPTLRVRDVVLDGAAVCDFGCGTGLLTERLADRAGRIDAVDTSAGMLAVVRSKIERSGWPHVRALDAPAGERGDYDVVVCSSVCAFLADYPATVHDLVAMLRPGGVFVQWDWERIDGDPDSFGLSRSTIGDTLRGAGLTSVAVGAAFEVSVGEETMRPLIGAGQRRT